MACLFLVGCEDDDNGSIYECYTAAPTEKSVYIRDYNYARYRFFDLGVIRDPNADTLIRFIHPGDEIIRFELFEPGTETDQAGVACAYWLDPEHPNLSRTESKRFRRRGDDMRSAGMTGP